MKKGQAILEFTFAMIILMLLIYGLIMVFRWVGLDLAERRIQHEMVLTDNSLSPQEQVNPNFYRPKKMRTVFRGLNLLR